MPLDHRAHLSAACRERQGTELIPFKNANLPIPEYQASESLHAILHRLLACLSSSLRENETLRLELGIAAATHRKMEDVLDQTKATLRWERGKSADSLGKINSQLAHALRLASMGELAVWIGHEVNQSLTSIVTGAELALKCLSDHQPDIKKATFHTRSIADEGMRLAGLMQSIRRLSKGSAKPAHAVQIDVLIEEVLPLVNQRCQTQQIDLHLALGCDGRFVAGDAVQLQQVVLNLAMNAIEAMTGISDRDRILEISSERKSNDIQVSVADTGPGIDTEMSNRLFEPFFTTKASGLGMGLAICQRIIEAHSGKICAAPRDPKGTIFSFTLAEVPPR